MTAGLTTLVPVLWGAVVVAGAWRHRPAPARMLALVDASGGDRRRLSPVRRLGRLLRRGAGLADDPLRERRAGWVALSAASALVVSPLAPPAVVLASLAGFAAGRRRLSRRHEEDVVASVPDTIDLFALAAGAGHPVQRSLQMVAPRAGGPLGEQLRLAAERIERGERTGDALERVAVTLGDAVRALTSVLCASERYGTPLVPALERLAAEARTDRRRRAEAAARRVPVQLLFPLVLCTLPAFALLTVVPLMIGAFASLRL